MGGQCASGRAGIGSMPSGSHQQGERVRAGYLTPPVPVPALSDDQGTSGSRNGDEVSELLSVERGKPPSPFARVFLDVPDANQGIG